jgi:hypothetical protein
MKTVTLEEFEAAKVQKPNPIADKAIEVWLEFLDKPDLVAEIEHSDFGGLLDLDDEKQRVKAVNALRNAANRSMLKKDYDLCVRQRGNKIFIGERKDIGREPQKELASVFRHSPWR